MTSSCRYLFLLGAFVCLAHAWGDDSELRVALTGKYPPFSMYNAEGELVGFDVDVSREIAKRLDRELSLVATEWDGILPGLLAGRYDAIIGSMAITPARQRQVDFTTPYYLSGAQLFIHEKLKDQVSSIADCKGKRLGVVLGETFETYLRDKHPEIEVVTYKSTVDISRDVQNGRLTGFVSDKLLGAYQVKRNGMPFMPVGSLLYRERMGIPVTKGNIALREQINKALQDMQSDGNTDKLFSKWFGLRKRTPPSSETTSVNPGNDGPGMTWATAMKMLGQGFGLTLLIAFASIAIGFLIAVPEGLLLNHPDNVASWLLRAFNDFLRGTPVLIQLFFVYFGVGGFLSSQFDIQVPALIAAIFTLSINGSTYMAEVVRSGLMSVASGQKEAARALGLTPTQTFFSVVWPQAFRIALPPLMNSVVALIKDTALVSVITVPEVIRQAQSIISVTFQPSRYYLLVAIMFFVVTFPLMKLAGRMEERIRERGFAHD